MKHKIFAINDIKAKAYFPPFYLPETEMAQRKFGDLINTETELSLHPADYTLFELGEWDDNTAEFTLLEIKENLGNGLEYVAQDVGVTNEPLYEGDEASGD